MAGLILYLRSAASAVVSGQTTNVHTLSTALGAAVANDGTAFIEIVNSNNNIGPGTNISGGPTGIITTNGKGWIYDTSLQGNTILAGTWTVNPSLIRGSGGAHTGNLHCEIYKVTANTTNVVNVFLIASGNSLSNNAATLSLAATPTKFPFTIQGGQAKFNRNEYLYIQFFWLDQTVGTGVFGNQVDNTTAATAANVLSPNMITTPGTKIRSNGTFSSPEFLEGGSDVTDGRMKMYAGNNNTRILNMVEISGGGISRLYANGTFNTNSFSEVG